MYVYPKGKKQKRFWAAFLLVISNLCSAGYKGGRKGRKQGARAE